MSEAPLGNGSQQSQGETPSTIALPAPTVWPFVLALGTALTAFGLVTNLIFTALGGALVIVGIAGWVSQLLPGHGEVEEPVAPPSERAAPVRSPRPVERIRAGTLGARIQVPEKRHPYSAGAVGGLFGGIAMAVIAITWGLVSGHGPWFPINLLAGTVLPGLANMDDTQLAQLSFAGLAIGTLIHLVGSVGVGLLNGLLLPMFPRFPILWGGIVAPLLWSGFVWGFMGVINPTLEHHVSWPWFIASQFAFGLVAGAVVLRSEKVLTEPVAGQGGQS